MQPKTLPLFPDDDRPEPSTDGKVKRSAFPSTKAIAESGIELVDMKAELAWQKRVKDEQLRAMRSTGPTVKEMQADLKRNKEGTCQTKS